MPSRVSRSSWILTGRTSVTKATSTSPSASRKSRTSSRAPRSKYGNKLTVVDGIKFHSKVEAARWKELKARAAAGHIEGLERQVPFKIIWPGETKPVTTYICDFYYKEGDAWIVEDVKGKVTDLYRLKSKLMKVAHGVEVREVFKRSHQGTARWYIGKVLEGPPVLPRIE
jgi:hypothetical protein